MLQWVKYTINKIKYLIEQSGKMFQLSKENLKSKDRIEK